MTKKSDGQCIYCMTKKAKGETCDTDDECNYKCRNKQCADKVLNRWKFDGKTVLEART